MARRKYRPRNRRPRSRGKSPTAQAAATPMIEDELNEESWSFESDGEQEISLKPSLVERTSSHRATPSRQQGLLNFPSADAEFVTPAWLKELPEVKMHSLFSSQRPVFTQHINTRLGQIHALQESFEKTERVTKIGSLGPLKSIFDDNRLVQQVQEANRSLSRLKRSTSLGATLSYRDQRALEDLEKHNRRLRRLDPTGVLGRLK